MNRCAFGSARASMLGWLLLLAGTAPLAAQIAVTPVRIAGLPPSAWSIGDGGAAIDALLTPSALAWDRNGNLLIADSRNQRIRRITPDGLISTLLNQEAVAGMAVDSRDNLYVSTYPSYDKPSQLFRLSPAGVKTEIPIPGSPGPTPAIAIDAADNLYVTEQLAQGGGLVWKRSPAGAVEKIAGSGAGGTPGQGGPALEVALGGPHALAFDRSGNLLIADWSGILRLNPDGTLIRLVGGPAQFLAPVRIAAASDGAIYFIDQNSYGISRWDAMRGVEHYAGTPQARFSDGCALSGGRRIARYASFNPSDLAIDTAGRIYVADNFIDIYDPGQIYSYSAGRIRRIDSDGSIRTVAGAGSMPHESAPGGPALGAIFHNPEALAVDAEGNVFFSESGANHVHQITAAGQILTVAGADSPPAGEDPACYPPGKDVLLSPHGIATGEHGNLYISDTANHRILRRSADGAITTIAGTGIEGQTGDGGPALQAQISRPTAVAVKPDGSIYFVSDGQVRRITTAGIIDSPQAPRGIEWLTLGFDGRLILSGSKLYKEAADGALYALRAGVGGVAADLSGAIYSLSQLRISPNCSVASVAVSHEPSQPPQGLAGHPAGGLLLSSDNSVWRIAAVAAPALDSPSPYLDNPGVFNAASNLTAYVTVPPPCFKQCGPYPRNDSIAGNEIVRITGGCMGLLEPLKSSYEGGRLPDSLHGTRVLFDGEPAPLLSVQATEILAIVPHDVAAKSNVTVAVENQGVQATAFLTAAPAAPGVFISSGTGAAAINGDASLNGAAHPAPVGSVVVLYLTGAGATNPPAGDGLPPGLPLPPLELPVTVLVGGVPAEVLYAGSVLGFVGLAQVNIRVPAVAASSAVPVQVSIGGISRNQAVTIAIE
jgi:uncharacterized protein (TIGR03437 family)